MEVSTNSAELRELLIFRIKPGLITLYIGQSQFVAVHAFYLESNWRRAEHIPRLSVSKAHRF